MLRPHEGSASRKTGVGTRGDAAADANGTGLMSYEWSGRMSKELSRCLHEVGLIPQRVNIAREHQPRLLHQDVQLDWLVAVGGDPDALDGEVGDAAHDGGEDRVVQIPGGYLGEGVTRWHSLRRARW